MVAALFDTNVLVDYLNSVPAARTELSRYGEKAISVMTWIEVLVGATPATEIATRTYLQSFKILAIDDAVADETVMLRRSHRLKLPDAIIWATARTHSMLLVTRNTKDFPPGDPGVRMPYRL
jgi:predicted nucleic acid-binding protein